MCRKDRLNSDSCGAQEELCPQSSDSRASESLSWATTSSSRQASRHIPKLPLFSQSAPLLSSESHGSRV